MVYRGKHYLSYFCSDTSRHWGVQLILAYSWARPAILVQVRVERECFYFFCFFTFTPVPLSSLSSLSSLLLSLLSLFSLSLGDNTKWPTRVDVSLNPNTINISVLNIDCGCGCYIAFKAMDLNDKKQIYQCVFLQKKHVTWHDILSADYANLLELLWRYLVCWKNNHHENTPIYFWPP